MPFPACMVRTSGNEDLSFSHSSASKHHSPPGIPDEMQFFAQHSVHFYNCYCIMGIVVCCYTDKNTSH